MPVTGALWAQLKGGAVPGPRMLRGASCGLWAIKCLWSGSKRPFTAAEDKPAGRVGPLPTETRARISLPVCRVICR